MLLSPASSGGRPLKGSALTSLFCLVQLLPMSEHLLKEVGLGSAEHLISQKKKWHEPPKQHFLPISGLGFDILLKFIGKTWQKSKKENADELIILRAIGLSRITVLTNVDALRISVYEVPD